MAASPFKRINIDGSGRLTEAILKSGCCKRLPLMSSRAARHPELLWYTSSKFRDERQVRRVAKDIAVAVFRSRTVRRCTGPVILMNAALVRMVASRMAAKPWNRTMRGSPSFAGRIWPAAVLQWLPHKSC